MRMITKLWPVTRLDTGDPTEWDSVCCKVDDGAILFFKLSDNWHCSTYFDEESIKNVFCYASDEPLNYQQALEVYKHIELKIPLKELQRVYTENETILRRHKKS